MANSLVFVVKYVSSNTNALSPNVTSLNCEEEENANLWSFFKYQLHLRNYNLV